MLGFAIVDRQPKANATAVWLTSRVEGSLLVNHTNAVVVQHDDERHDDTVWALTADRAVVLTQGTTPPISFVHALGIEAFDVLIDETAARQQLIADAVTAYAQKTRNRNLVIPDFSKDRPKLTMDVRNEPEFRALSVANYVAQVWRTWIITDEQRVRRTINPKTKKPPWIMPEELGDPVVAEFPPEFAELAKPEPTTRCSTT
ncbi:hypothetical protein H7H82_11800 [Mycobacterium heidelbergense]|uniref:Uncharacterized protein n=1 Tax=Mycobacterium heidelbergense TaxID=53376 RepID=A0A1X0DB87_MYCHE|nr:hypothetical protein [Mycobacterium heidelbergense]MCV7051270.1 hypothetical protein [Mycobacterium heidelbergense]ORA69608.1 hypothetical protein BST25_21250 [Mycobacterium heidelbergense]